MTNEKFVPPFTKTDDGRKIIEWRTYGDVKHHWIAISEDNKWCWATVIYWTNLNCSKPSCLASQRPPLGETLWRAEEQKEIIGSVRGPDDFAKPIKAKKRHINITIIYDRPTMYASKHPDEVVDRCNQWSQEVKERRDAAVKAFKLHPKKYGAPDNNWPYCCGEECGIFFPIHTGSVIIMCRRKNKQ